MKPSVILKGAVKGFDRVTKAACRHHLGRAFESHRLHNDGADFLAALEENIEVWEPGQLKGLRCPTNVSAASRGRP